MGMTRKRNAATHDAQRSRIVDESTGRQVDETMTMWYVQKYYIG